ncbi:MAG: TonB-dependent receptor, partial [Saprospiraceae bacterium]|nr:TonB-dependent receptor [Saprospiraceae bacterium]
AKEIQLLGLRGLYTQLLTENVPDFYGLAMPYALEYLPGTWLQQIDVNKGAGSVKNGFQSITGQINASLVQPGEDAPVFINLFGENTGRMEANVHLNRVESETFAHSLLLHGSSFQNKLDRDRDFFVDMPLKKQLNGMYRAFFNNGKWESQLKIHGLTENRKSGQLIDNERNIKPFLIDATNNRLSAGLKLGYVGFEKPYNSIGSQWQITYHDVAAQYGKNRYEGTQRSFLGNMLFATVFGTTDHKITYGASLQYDDFREFLNERDLSRRDIYTGLNAEYVYTRPHLDGYNDVTIVAGLRGDYHNRSGFCFTPRLNLKYNFNEGDVVRVSAGRGWRVANPIAENVAFLATNRDILISDNLKPEDAWNFGLNFVKTFKIGNNRTARWNLDLYRTQFTNQVITDIESDFKTVQFYNLNGKSFSNTLLTMLTAEVLPFLDVKIAYTLTDVQATYQGQLARVPLVPRHRGLVGLDVKTTNKKWLFNATAQLVGQQRLANRSYTPSDFHHDHDGKSDRFGLVHFSVNHFFKNMEIYGGVENAFDYTQEHAIIAWQEPTSIYFDATQVYAPMLGRRIYAGLRWRLGVKK